MTRFMVVRGDDNGHTFIVADALDAATATARYQACLKGHKQWYAIWSYDSAEERRALITRHILHV